MNDSNGSSNPAGTIVLVLFLLLAAAAAAVAVYKGWAKSIAMSVQRSVAAWVRGDADASAYIRNRDSARAGSAGSAGSAAPMEGAGLGPAGATTYNPPA